MIADLIAENLDLVIGIDHDAGPGRNARDGRAGMTEIAGIVLENLVVIDARAIAGLRQVRHVEDQNAARIVGRHIVVDVRADRILDLDSGDIEFRPAVADNHITRLADIDAGIRCADGHHAFNQRVRGLHGINAISAIVRIGTIGPFGAHPADDDVFTLIHLQRIATRILDGQVLNGEIAGRDQQAFRAGRLVGKGQYGFVHTGPANGDTIHGQGQRPFEGKDAGRNFDHIARLRVDQLLHQRGLEVGVRAGQIAALIATATRGERQ